MGSRKSSPKVSSGRLETDYIDSILCSVCGGDAYCIRRVPLAGLNLNEERTFRCSGCGKLTVRVFAPKESDAEIEALAERMSGMASRKHKKDGLLT